MDSPFAAGFEPAGLPLGDLAYTLPDDVVFASAGQLIPGDPSADFDIDYEITPCLLVGNVGDCETALPPGADPYTYIAELTVVDIGGLIPETGVLLFLSGLSGTPDYDPVDINLVLNPAPRAGFEFSELELIEYSPGDDVFYYLGVRLHAEDVGETFTFEFRVNTDQLAGGTPQFFTNAAYEFDVVPEPASGVLLAIGLLGIAAYRRRQWFPVRLAGPAVLGSRHSVGFSSSRF